MTLSEIRKSDKDFLTANDIAGLLQAAPENIRAQARKDPKSFPFPVLVIGTRVKFPRIPFLKFIGGLAD